MDIQLKFEFPSLPSGFNLTGLAESVFTANPDVHYFARSEVTFRFNCDISFLRNGAFFWIPVVSLRKNNLDLSEPLCAVKFENNRPPPQSPRGITIQYFPHNQDTPATNVLLLPTLPQSLVEDSRTLHNLPQWVQDSCLSIKNEDMKLCKSGVGGTYFVCDSEVTEGNEAQILSSVFKPVDEEPGAPNNPKQIPTSFIPMMSWGKGAHREVAAFMLDKGFVGVPETYFVEVTNNQGIKKEGSLQKFVKNDGDCSDVGANKFSVEDVHRVGIFDIRILNMDRNDENLLVLKSNDNEWKLIPIDHTYAFPNKINSYFNWQFWNQTKRPFSSESLAYISSIDSISDALMLLDTGIDEESVRNVTGSTLLLQKAASKGLNLFQIASMVSGKENDLVKILSKEKEKEELYKENIRDATTVEKLNIFKNFMEEITEEVLKTKLVELKL